MGRLGADDVLAALQATNDGRVFDLDAGRFNGVPQWDGHPKFMITAFRTPAGSRVNGDIELLAPENNSIDLRFYTELMVTGMHIGTHIDALNHVACGTEGDTIYGGFGPEIAGDFGPVRADASTIPPIIVRTAIFDFARIRGVTHLPAGAPITRDDLMAAEANGTAIPHGGAVLIRTGAMTTWPDADAFGAIASAGLTLDAAEWLANERNIVLVGSDTPTVEQVPSSTPGNPHPVHELLLRQLGVHLLENVWLEDVAQAQVSHATLIVLPLKVTGATGSMVRPIAIT